MAGTLFINSQLMDHKLDHLADPLLSEGLEAVQKAISAHSRTPCLALLTNHEFLDDSLVHL